MEVLIGLALVVFGLGIWLGFTLKASPPDEPEKPCMPAGPWEQRWHGSVPERGDSIFCDGDRIAYLGDQHHDAVSRLVYEHNSAFARCR